MKNEKANKAVCVVEMRFTLLFYSPRRMYGDTLTFGQMIYLSRRHCAVRLSTGFKNYRQSNVYRKFKNPDLHSLELNLKHDKNCN